MLVDYFRLGVKNLRTRGLRSWLTMIGIFIGIAAIVALISLGQGLKTAVVGQFAGLGTNTVTIQASGGGFGPPGSYQSITIGSDDLRVIKRVRGVDEAFGRTIDPVRVEVDGTQDFSYIVSIPQDSSEYNLAVTLPTKLETVSGRLVKPTDSCKVMIGNNLAEKESLVRKLVVGDKLVIEGVNVDVVGILTKTGNPQLDSTLFIPEDCVRRITGEKDKYGLIVARTVNGEDTNAVKANIEKELRKSRNVEVGREDFQVSTSQDTIDSLNSILGAVNWFLIGIAAISLLVGAVGITNTMYTAVMERTGEIGIMKAVGARNSTIMELFLVESGLLGMTGGAIGIALGMGLASLVSIIAKGAGFDLLEANFSLWLILGALLFSFILGSLSGVLPARQAARLQPVEAFRSD